MMLLLPIGPRSDTLITNEETGGEAYYNKTEQRPDYPGGASGVTIADGYDLGYADAATIRRDWSPYLPAAAVERLASVAGIHGRPAASHAAELHDIVVPWSAALAVFHDVDLPKWSRAVASTLPNCDKLPPDCFGCLVSIAFNRGNAWNELGDRYLEMRNIKGLMAVGRFAGIPAQIRAMKRHWPAGTPGHADLVARREHEAALFDLALKEAAAGAPAGAVPVAPASVLSEGATPPDALARTLAPAPPRSARELAPPPPPDRQGSGGA